MGLNFYIRKDYLHMESRSSRHGHTSGPRKNPFLVNMILFTLIFVGVIFLANWMAPNIMQWLSSSPVEPTIAPSAQGDTNQRKTVTQATTVAKLTATPVSSVAPSPSANLQAVSTEDPYALSFVGDLLEKDRINIRLVGDILLGNRVADFMKEKGIEYPYQNIKEENLLKTK